LSAPADLQAGSVVAARYEILSTLGKGGMGTVFKAHDRLLNETVAIKVLRSDVAGAQEMAQRFIAEIKLARSVSHKSVSRIHEYGEDQGLRYISMAFVDGVDLKRVLRDRGPLPPDEAFRVAIQVAEALQAIHDEGIIHRDLKTPNLMMDSRGAIRLMDFGIAKLWEANTGLTATGHIVGTPEYMSPEQVRGIKLDFRSDVYALGIVVYELFTGDTPFRAETPVGTLMKHLEEKPPLEGPAAARIPPALVPVLARALAKDREERYPQARDLAEALQLARAGTSPSLTSPPASVAMRAEATTLPLAPPPARSVQSTVRVAVPAPDPTAPAHLPPTAVAIAASPAKKTSQPLLVGGLIAGTIVAALVLTLALVRRQPAERRSVVPPVSVAVAPATPRSAPPASIESPTPSAIREPEVARSVSPTTVPVRPAATPPVAPPTLSPARAAEVSGALAEAESAFASQRYEAAISFYDQVLSLDPANERARVGKDLCAQALLQAGTMRRPAKAFTVGQTSVSTAQPAAQGPAGFETSAGVKVKRLDQPATAPGKIAFEIEPSVVKPGDPYTVKVYFVNEGAQALSLAAATVTTNLNGRSASGDVPLLARDVPPRQRALILSVSDQWKSEVASWSMAVAVRTPRGETYRNEAAWK
jgi:serine/threonine protein kinase